MIVRVTPALTKLMRPLEAQNFTTMTLTAKCSIVRAHSSEIT